MIYKVVCEQTGNALEFQIIPGYVNVELIKDGEKLTNVLITEIQLYQLIGALHHIQKQITQ